MNERETNVFLLEEFDFLWRVLGDECFSARTMMNEKPEPFTEMAIQASHAVLGKHWVCDTQR